MTGYGQFCPVAKAAEVVAERWTPLVLRELFCGSTRFNQLRRGLPLMSQSLLSRRLRTLEQAGVITRSKRKETASFEYRLTEAGQELWPVIEQLGVWGKRWLRARIQQGDLDAGLLMWDIHRNLVCDPWPRPRIVVRFQFTGAERGQQRWWLLLERGEVQLCLLDPGFDVDLSVRTSLRTLTEIWLGDLDLSRALAGGALQLDGPRELTRAFPTWLRFSELTRVDRRV